MPPIKNQLNESGIVFKDESGVMDGSESSFGLNGGGNEQAVWNFGDRVLCRYLNSEIYYDAKIITIDNFDGQPRYGIHFQVL